MNDERLRQLYGRGIAGRDARSELAGACAVEPERLLALVRRELPEEEGLALLDQVMSSPACREAFELLRVVEAAGREHGGARSLRLEDDEEEPGGAMEAEPGDEALPTAAQPAAPPATTPPATASPAGMQSAATPSEGPAPISLMSSTSSSGSPSRSHDARASRAPWWRRGGAQMALAACSLLAVGLVARERMGGGVEATRGSAGAGVELVSPATDIGADAAMTTFVWRAVPGATRYELELLGAQGEPVYQGATTDTSLVLPADVALQPGAEYRWLVRAGTTDGAQLSSPARPLRLLAR